MYFNFLLFLTLLSVCNKYIICIRFCGHYHRNAGGIYTNPENGAQLECVTSSAVGTTLITNKTGNKLDLNGMGSVELNESTSGFRVVCVNEKEVTHEWKTLSEF